MKAPLQLSKACAALLLLALSETAYSAELTVLSAGAAKAALADIANAYQQATGQIVIIDYAPVGTIMKRLQNGEQPAVLVVTADVMADVQRNGWSRKGSALAIGSVGIGVAVQDHAKLPDISSEESFKQTLLAAKSITYIDPEKGTSGKHVAAVLQRLGIAEQMQSKTTLGDSGYVVEPVAKGDIELGIQQITEILPVKGVKLVGPLPPSLQKRTTYIATVGASGTSGELAQAFVSYLRSASAQALFVDRGFSPPQDQN